jgi:tetratricopeptide (TPR) repeat protein
MEQSCERVTCQVRRGGPRAAEEQAHEWMIRLAEELADDPNVAPMIAEELRMRRRYGQPLEAAEWNRCYPSLEAALRPFLEGTSDTEPTAPDFPECGELFADCLLLTELGRGAQGRVFLATQPLLADRPVVLKVTRLAGAEHLSLARLNHPHVVPLHFVQEFPERGLRVLCMPYLGGATLAEVLAELRHLPPAQRTGRSLLEALDRVQADSLLLGPDRTPTPIRTLLARLSYEEAVCWLGACLANALHDAHQRGLVHLDIKPDNILLDRDGRPMLLDFHLARAPLPAGSPAPEWFGGTPCYMSPEQGLALCARPGQVVPLAVDGRSDLYSLGMVLHELLAGGPALLDGPWVDGLHRANPAASPSLVALVTRCLSPEPAQRYPDAAALADDLRRHLASRPLRGVANQSLLERWRKWRRRRPHALGRAGLLALALASLLTLAASFCLQQSTRQQDAERVRIGQHQRADRAREASRLHQTAETLRFLCDPEALAPDRVRALDAQCASLWKGRTRLLQTAPGEFSLAEEGRLREDLLDLAVLWADLHVRAADGAEEGRRQALLVLNEAEALLGPNLALEYERRRHLSAPDDLPAPQSGRDHYALGRALLRAGRVARAAEEFEAALRQQPQTFWPNFYRGLCAYRLGEYGQAAAAFEVCVVLAPGQAVCHYNRGLAQEALQQFALARRDYDQAIELDRDFASAWLNRGALSCRQGRLDEALADLRQALALGADPALVHYNLAIVHYARRDMEGARRLLNRALDYRPDHARARHLLAQLSR